MKKSILHRAILIGATASIANVNASFNQGSDALVSGVCNYSCWQGTDGDLFFWAHDSSDTNGSFFYNLTANNSITVDTLFAGSEFTVMLETDLSLYNNWGVIGTSHDVSTSYAYGKAGVALGAIVSASGMITPSTSINNPSDSITSAVNNWSNEINAALGGADKGQVITSDAADKNNSGVRVVSYFQGGNFSTSQQIFFYGILDLTPEPLFDPGAVDETVSVTALLNAPTLSIDPFEAKLYSSFSQTTVPLPSSIWLFASAFAAFFRIKSIQ